MDVRQIITDRIISMLEKGEGYFRERWSRASQHGMPRSGKTGNAYKGINVLVLWDAALENSYASNVWLTFKQAQEMGAQVRKGEKGTMCVYFEMVQKKAKANEDEADFFPMCKAFWLFNVAQIEGLPADITATDEKKSQEIFDQCELGEMLLRTSGARIAYGFDSAMYSPSKDMIGMPDKNKFFSAEDYYSTAVHELTHWTGHETRLNRVFGKRFGDDAYAMEELVAEISASFLCAELGFINKTIPNHVSYIESWLKVLKNDKNAIFTAAKQANLATTYLLEKAGLTAKDEEIKQAA